MTDDFDDDFPGAIVSSPAFTFRIGEPSRAASMFGHGCGTHMESGVTFGRGEPFIRQAVSRDIPIDVWAQGWRVWWQSDFGWAIDGCLRSYEPSLTEVGWREGFEKAGDMIHSWTSIFSRYEPFQYTS